MITMTASPKARVKSWASVSSTSTYDSGYYGATTSIFNSSHLIETAIMVTVRV